MLRVLMLGGATARRKNSAQPKGGVRNDVCRLTQISIASQTGSTFCASEHRQEKRRLRPRRALAWSARRERAKLPASARHAPIGGQVPLAARLVVPKHVHVPVVGVDLEPALRRREPAIDDLSYGEPAFTEPERDRFLVAAIAGIAF